jgi:hypothetical protein
MDRRQLRLDSEEIDILIKRGKDLLADGDVAAARLLFHRAAEADSAEGAFTLGPTFDPVSLQRALVQLAPCRILRKRGNGIGAPPSLAPAPPSNNWQVSGTLVEYFARASNSQISMLDCGCLC